MTRRILLGRIVGVHGIRGDVVIDSYTAVPQAIADYSPLETEDRSRQLELTVVRVAAKGVIAHLAGINDRTSAEALKGIELYTPRDRLPAARDDEYYYADLVGLAAEDASGDTIGSVVGVHNHGAGDILEVRRTGERSTELIPFTDAFVPAVDIAGRRVVVVMPAEAGEGEADAEGAE